MDRRVTDEKGQIWVKIRGKWYRLLNPKEYGKRIIEDFKERNG